MFDVDLRGVLLSSKFLAYSNVQPFEGLLVYCRTMAAERKLVLFGPRDVTHYLSSVLYIFQ